MGSKNRRAKAARAALAAHSNTTQMLHVAFAARDYTPHPMSLPPANPSNITSAPAQAQSLQEIELELLWEIKATARRRGHEVGLREGQCIGFREGMEAGMKKGLEQGHRDGYREGRFEGLRNGYREGRLEVRQAVPALSYPIAIAEPAYNAAPMSIFAVDAGDVLADTVTARIALHAALPTAFTPALPAPIATTSNALGFPSDTAHRTMTRHAPDGHSKAAPPSATDRERDEQPTAANRELHEVCSPNAHITPTISQPATRTPPANTHNSQPATRGTTRANVATSGSEECQGVRTDDVRNASGAHGGPTRTVRPAASPVPRASSLVPHTGSMGSNTTPTSPSNPAPPFAIARELDRPPAAIKRETREVRSVTAHRAHPIASLASQTPPATPHDSYTRPHGDTCPSAAENELEEDSGPREDRVRTASDEQSGGTHTVCTASPASHMHTATPRDVPTPPRVHTRTNAISAGPEESHGASADDMRNASTAHGKGTCTVRTTASPASHTHTATLHRTRPAPHASSLALHSTFASSNDAPTPCSHSASPLPMACEPDRAPAATKCEPRKIRSATAHPAPSAISLASHMPSTASHDVPTSDHSGASPRATANEPDKCLEGCGDDTHVANNAYEHPAPQCALAAIHNTSPSDMLASNIGNRCKLTVTYEPGGRCAARTNATHDASNANMRTTFKANTLRSTQSAPPFASREVPAPMRNNAIMPAAGVEPGEPRVAAANNLRTAPSTTRTTLHVTACVLERGNKMGWNEGRKKGREDGFREGLEVGRRMGMLEGRELGYREGKAAGSKDGLERARDEHANLAVPVVSHMNNGTGHMIIVASTQPSVSPIAASTTAFSTVNISRSSTHFSWADDVESLPIIAVPLPLIARDFSILRSGSTASPFWSLQCRARRSHRSATFSQHRSFTPTWQHLAGFRSAGSSA